MRTKNALKIAQKVPQKGAFLLFFAKNRSFCQIKARQIVFKKFGGCRQRGVILRQKQDKDSGLAVDTRNGHTPFSFLCRQANIYPRKCRYHLRDFFVSRPAGVSGELGRLPCGRRKTTAKCIRTTREWQSQTFKRKCERGHGLVNVPLLLPKAVSE